MDTFVTSVYDCTDDYGNLTLADAKSLFTQHGMDYWEEHNSNDMPLTLKARTLLQWLGY